MTDKAKAWRKKYYPIQASKCKKADALDHSILKWTGLQENVLKKYGLQLNWLRDVVDELGVLVLEIGVNSCALCKFFFEKKCPLMPDGCNGGCDGNWARFIVYWDTVSMLKALKAAKKREAKS
jgi:hypothetical protein